MNFSFTKQCIAAILFIGFSTALSAQNEMAMAYTDANTFKTKSKTKAINSEFLKASSHQKFAKRIDKFQKLVANHDITEESIYAPKSKSTYKVKFNEKSNKITAVYDKEGKLLSCTESYKDMRLPYDIAKELAIKYPNWTTESTTCKISYKKGKEKTALYKIKIAKGKKTKTVSFKS